MIIELHPILTDLSTWSHMFNLDETATWAEKIIRPVVVYIALIVLLRVFGKRELAQLNPMDLVVILSLSNTVQNAIIGQDNSVVGGLVGASSLLAINYGIARLKWTSKKIEALVEGPPALLIEHGQLRKSEMKHELITRSDIDIIAHSNGFENASDIDKLVLDPNGTFLIDGKDEVKDPRFKIEVLKKIDALTKQIEHLSSAIEKGKV
ncbi:MAG: YetF domain-containing protein [Acidobacteriota bacterium]